MVSPFAPALGVAVSIGDLPSLCRTIENADARLVSDT
jgi:hypothetical protein